MKKVSAKQQVELRLRKLLKAQLILESGGLCQVCGKRGDWRGLSLIHKMALSRGGLTSPGNCIVGCYSCHSKYHHIKEQDSKPMWSKK